ncbi:MAG: TIM barrel protein [Oceanospirillales bacterium]|nr:TIM barrel protein [Oceanospirillales bacterium]MBR9889883.1 TIM barrel protein [Oceanospirillales bacterium]
MAEDRIILNVGVLPYRLEKKLALAEQLGFGVIEIGNTDLTTPDQNLQTNASILQNSALKVAAFHELKDFLGHPSHLMDYKMNLAKSNLRLMENVGADLLIVSPATENYSKPDLQRMVEELRALAMLGTVRGVRIGFKPLPWSESINNYQDAITLITQANNANLCLVIDNIALRHCSDEGLATLIRAIPMEMVGLVQLSAIHNQDSVQHTTIPTRMLPTKADHEPVIPELIRLMEQQGYQGRYSLYAQSIPYRGCSEEIVSAEISNSLAYVKALLTPNV